MTEQAVTTKPDNGVASIPAIVDLAQNYGLSAAAFVFTFKSVAMPQPHTDAEFVSCCLVAREHKLNPLTKEIFFMRTKSGQIQPIVSVDGWIRKCNEHPQFDGMEFKETHDDKGALVSMTISIYRKDRSRPTTITEYFDECSRAGGPVWKTSPHRMMRNRTICQGGRISFGFAGIMEYDEFLQWQAQEGASNQWASSRSALKAVPSSYVPMDASGVPEMDEPEVQEAPSDITDVPDDRLSAVEEARALAELREAIDGADSPGIRMEIVEGYESLIDRMTPAGRRAAEKIIEGRE